MLGSMRLSGKVALGFIRRRGLAAFLRKLPPLSELRALLLPPRVAFAAGEDVIGGLDMAHGERLDPYSGVIRGWVLSRGEPIDRVELFLEDDSIGNARIAVPHPLVCHGMPDAAVSGFRSFLPVVATGDQGGTMRARAVAHGFSGSIYLIAAGEFHLKPRRDVARTEGSGAASVGAGRVDARRGAKIRVACFAHDMDYGGAQLFLWELLRLSVAEEDMDFVVFSPTDGPLRRELSELNIPVELFREPAKTNERRHEHEITALAKRLRDGGFDCVLANTLLGFFAVNAAAEAGIPSIWAIHESFSPPVWSAIYTADRPAGAFIASRLTAALARASAVTFVAEATRRLYLDDGAAKKFLHIPYGIDTAAISDFLATFDRTAARSRLEIAPDDFVLLCIGNFEARKQQILLAQAFAEVSRRRPNTILLLVGELPSLYSAILREYLDERGIGQNIRLVPAVRQTYPWYGIADAFALLSDLESMPRALMEAMAFGLPVLATNVFGIPELVEHGRTGFLVPPNSRLSAVTGLETLLGLSASKRREMAEAARDSIVRNHDSRGYAEAYVALIKRVSA
jgi:D-inositol-3-phosphate glycosyltransferase